MRTRVSVIIPTYNRAHTLPRALASVLSQDFNDLELLVVDDGSDDETAQLLAGIADPRLRRLRWERNRGIGAARHEGVTQSQGELIAFLDSDDVWKPGKLAKVVAALDRHPHLDLVFSDYEDINYMRATMERGFHLVSAGLRLLEVSPLGPDWWTVEAGMPEALIRRNVLGTCSVVVVRRTVFARVGGFRTSLSGAEDLEMWWRAAILGARFAYTTEVLAERHKEGDSITADARAFAPRRLMALAACVETARQAGRLELLPLLRQAHADTWHDLLKTCARAGRRVETLRAFRERIRYGMSGESVRHLAMGMMGPRITDLARRVLRR